MNPRQKECTESSKSGEVARTESFEKEFMFHTEIKAVREKGVSDINQKTRTLSERKWG